MLRTAVHRGQWKLGLGLIRLLTKHGDVAPTVLYVGAAPGTNIAYVARLFPRHEFHLYDPAPFDLKAGELADVDGNPVARRLHVHREFFTDETAREWAAKEGGLIFVSDIRKSTPRDEDFEDEVRENMAAQLAWYEALGPRARAAMFKFRLPYGSAEAVPYPKGEIWLQPFAALSSTETRLVVLGPAAEAPRVVYDAKAYEEEMMWHNTVAREWGFYPLPGAPKGLVGGVEGYDGCYDCRAAAEILLEYLDLRAELYFGPFGALIRDVFRANPALALLHVGDIFAAAAAHLRQPLLSPPHGVDPGRPMHERRAGLYGYLAESDAKRSHRLDVHKASQRRAGGAPPRRAGGAPQRPPAPRPERP